MKRWIEIFRPIITLFLVLQLSSVSSLPAGVFVNLCFGSDGHFDISQELCAKKPHPLEFAGPTEITAGNDHHVQCLDVPIGCCTLSDEALPSLTGVHSAKTKLKKSVPSAEVTQYPYHSADRQTHAVFYSSTPLNGVTLAPAHLVFLQTTLLLI